MLEIDLHYRRGAFALAARAVLPVPGVTALFGRSGSGKTTLVNLLAGLARPDAGHVRLAGVVLTDIAAGVFVPPERRGVGYVFQDGRLFPHYTVRGNLRYGAARARGGPSFDDVVALLDLGPLLERRPARLSGGERQRVALGRALLSGPSLLLLDEPLASLDAARRDELLPYLEGLRDRLGLPMVYVSHQFDEVVRLADHVLVVEGGQVVAEGALPAVATHPATRALVGSQALAAVLVGVADAPDPVTGLQPVRTSAGQILAGGLPVAAGTPLRLQVLARDVILARRTGEWAAAPPAGLSVRNALPATVVSVEPGGDQTMVAELAADAGRLLARVTPDAVRDLGLKPGSPVWALIKAVSVRTGGTPRPPA